MYITYKKSIRLETPCEDKESINNKRSKGHKLVLENYPNTKNKNAVMHLPNGTYFYFDAESMMRMCEKLIALEKI